MRTTFLEKTTNTDKRKNSKKMIIIKACNIQ